MSTSDWIALGELAVAIVDKTNIFIFCFRILRNSSKK